MKIDFKYFMEKEIKKPYFQLLKQKLEQEYKNFQVFPEKKDLFRAIKLTKFEDLKLVILGQDPYHQDGQADGLAFSTRSKKLPPSLLNLFSEIKNSYPNFTKTDGDLQNWAKQGVLLLNTVLSVRKSQPNSHENIGWKIFSNNLINFIVENKTDVVFLLLGQKAKSTVENINLENQKVFIYSHPSPFSFANSLKNSGVFRKINEFLRSKSQTEINWNF
ncbi:uracil-DNA glycosylase [Mycoplasma sp. 'Moose RK']|uniref:uracil-DNA glycosylase n=1 Tax=Mycoplasma sp. 'Moose RK' TaxID=2780095 RepID=UPI0018C1E004|nr:uracil-DNA glycosylase [Mycoplasma sp. 'Moose RK']MBG0730585.1 uracil-DNA glycosylase [Mycoplasma sp. 'Moose RK']